LLGALLVSLLGALLVPLGALLVPLGSLLVSLLGVAPASGAAVPVVHAPRAGSHASAELHVSSSVQPVASALHCSRRVPSQRRSAAVHVAGRQRPAGALWQSAALPQLCQSRQATPVSQYCSFAPLH
jgi:hypothetical protein